MPYLIALALIVGGALYIGARLFPRTDTSNARAARAGDRHDEPVVEPAPHRRGARQGDHP